MLTKLRKISKRINPYGGINFVIRALRKAKVAVLIDSALGKRVKQARYSYSDVILAWTYANLCGAERLEDIMHVRDPFNNIPENKCPSSDRLAGILKQFAVEDTKVQGKRDEKYSFNINLKLNDLLIKTAKQLNQLNGSTLDYDNVIIPTEKYDSEHTYKGFPGYQPGVSFIGNIPVYIEGRSGTALAKFKLLDTVKRSIALLKKNGISIKRFRSDAAAYQYELLNYLEDTGIDFFLRAQSSGNLFADYGLINSWETVEHDAVKYEIASYDFTPPKMSSDRKYRLVITKCVNYETKNKHNYTGEKYSTRAIITNNRSMSNKEVFHFYNQRGKMERNFDQLLNDFNWRRLPFSFLKQNTVFMIFSAMSCVMYNYVLQKFSKKMDCIEVTDRLKRFIFQFITVASWWENGELVIATDKNFERLWGD